MTVYVDDAEHKCGRMKMCHMLADTLPELMAMADRIGVARKWYQGFDKASCPHFDICKAKRAEAIQAGAQEITRHQLAQLTRHLKDEAIRRITDKQLHGWEQTHD